MITLPRRALSRWAGRIARTPASRWLIPWYARHYHVDMAEAAVPASGFASLQDFFTRQLRSGLRPIDASSDGLISPCDGTVGACGNVAKGQLVQAKGRMYALQELLGSEMAARFDGGIYCTLYLSPRDYHRVHAPADALVRHAWYVPGTYWPVNPAAVATVPRLFAMNQRLITLLETRQGLVGVVMVGACLVGAIRASYDPLWNAGPSPHAAAARCYEPPCRLARGQELGLFEFGSTVILICEPGVAQEWLRACGDVTRMGQKLAR